MNAITGAIRSEFINMGPSLEAGPQTKLFAGVAVH